MTVLHTGSTKNYSTNWSNIFSKAKKATQPKVANTKAAAKKKSAKKGKK